MLYPIELRVPAREIKRTVSKVERHDNLHEDVFDDMAVHISQAELPALVFVGETFVIKSQAMKNPSLRIATRSSYHSRASSHHARYSAAASFGRIITTLTMPNL
jgi:hypothetical protein